MAHTYQEGDAVQIIGGLFAGSTGTIVATFPDRERLCLVQIGDTCYVHLPEDDLAPADQETWLPNGS